MQRSDCLSTYSKASSHKWQTGCGSYLLIDCQLLLSTCSSKSMLTFLVFPIYVTLNILNCPHNQPCYDVLQWFVRKPNHVQNYRNLPLVKWWVADGRKNCLLLPRSPAALVLGWARWLSWGNWKKDRVSNVSTIFQRFFNIWESLGNHLGESFGTIIWENHLGIICPESVWAHVSPRG